MGFPYLKLPDLPQELIIKQLDVTDIIKLSLLSVKSSKSIKSSKIKVKLTWKINLVAHVSIKMKFATGRQILQLQMCTSDEWNALLIKYLSQNPGTLASLIIPTDNQYVINPFQIGNHTLFMESSDSLRIYLKPLNYDNLSHSCKLAYQQNNLIRIFDLLSVISYRLINAFQVVQFNYQSRFSAMPKFIADHPHRNYRFIDLHPIKPVSVEEACFYLESLPSIDNFSLRGFITKDYHSDKPLKHRKMLFSGHCLISIKNLINMNCYHLTIFNSEHINPATDLITLINDWIRGGNEQLEHLELNFLHHQVTNSIFSDLKTTPWNPEVRPGRHGDVNCEAGRDIKKATDNTLATIVIREPLTFYFLVWKEKYLNATSDSDNDSDSSYVGSSGDNSIYNGE